MSRISQDFINSIGYLYEEINIQQNDFLNEESHYYDAEATEIVEDILSTISSMMVYEGYSAEGIIGFLADSSEETIIEKYSSFDENILTENVISEDYIVEQLEIFDVAIEEGIGSLFGKVAKGAIGLAGRVASKPARAAVAKKIMTSKNPERLIGSASRVSAGGKTLDPTGAVERLARMKLNKAGMPSDMTKKVLDNSPNIGTKTSLAAFAPTMGKVVKGVQKVKDIAQGAKAALPKIAKGAGIFGLGAAGGFVGAKLAGAGSGSSESPNTSPSAPASSSKPPSASSASSGSSTSSAPSGSSTSSAPSGSSTSSLRSKGSSGQSKPPVSANQQYKDLIKAGKKSEAEKLGLKTWAAANPKLAAKLNPDGTQKGTGQSQMEKDAEDLRKMTNASKQRQGKLMGGPEGPGTIDKKQVEQDIKDEQEKQKAKLNQQKNSKPIDESYEPYDIILDYLIQDGHADTIEEAHYIMLEMDESAISLVMEEYENYLLAEEVSEWVDNLVNEGYDLSEYTWDDIVEYYVSEANRAERELGMNQRQREISRNLRYKNYYVKPSKRRPDSDFYNPENLKSKPKNTYSGDESDSWHDSMSQVRRVRSKVNKNKT